MKKFILIAAISVAVALAIFFWLRRSPSAPVPIIPSQLIPLVSSEQARKTICDLKKEGLFAPACQSKFNLVSKMDREKITELFSLLEQGQNDDRFPAYDRLLLSQVIFASLPTKDSPEAGLYLPGLVSKASAQPKTLTEAEFKTQMARDLNNLVAGLPPSDNAWVINVMVSRYSWKDGRSRPLYSHQYSEVYDPFPNNPGVNPRDITYHVLSVAGSQAAGQTANPEMMAYSFTIMSWKSREDNEADGPAEEKFLVKKENFSDTAYQGEPYLETLLNQVKMPATGRAAESPEEKEPGPRKITCEQWRSNYQVWKKTGEGDKCPWWILKPEQKLIWCANSEAEIRAYSREGDWLGTDSYMAAKAPKYNFDFDEDTCLEGLR